MKLIPGNLYYIEYCGAYEKSDFNPWSDVTVQNKIGLFLKEETMKNFDEKYEIRYPYLKRLTFLIEKRKLYFKIELKTEESIIRYDLVFKEFK